MCPRWQRCVLVDYSSTARQSALGLIITAPCLCLDLVSSLASGLLTIGPRFGGALDQAAEQFSNAYDSGMSPEDFVADTRNKKELIMGIGHKVGAFQVRNM